MDLNNLWDWNRKKLSCRVRVETGNPSGDELRRRVAELGKIDLSEIWDKMHTTKEGEGTKKVKKKRRDVVHSQKTEASKELSVSELGKTVTYRKHIVNAGEIAIDEMNQNEGIGTSLKNIHKKYVYVPSSPPRRVSMDIQRERTKVLNLNVQRGSSSNRVKLKKRQRRRTKRFDVAGAVEASNRRRGRGGKEEKEEDLSKNDIFKSYSGDLYGTRGDYMGGMVYLSRMPTLKQDGLHSKDLALSTEQAKKKKKKGRGESGGRNEEEDQNEEDDQASLHLDTASSFGDFRGNSPSLSTASRSREGLKAWVFCAGKLCQWAKNEVNAERLASEGAVRAIAEMSMDTYPRLQRMCSIAFRRMSDSPILGVAIIREGGLPAIVELSKATTNEVVIGNCAVTLTNLTKLEGFEDRLVEEGAIHCLMSVINDVPKFGIISARGLYNLTCVDDSYPFIERVIKSLVSIASTSHPEIKHITASALCNLADLKQIRMRMVEEGIISVLSLLARGAEPRTKRVCGIILQNLASGKSCRNEMVSRGAVQACYGLSGDSDPVILQSLAVTLSRLASDSINCSRIINEGGVSALCNISLRFPGIPDISVPCALALQKLSQNEHVRQTMVQEGCTQALISLLKGYSDGQTLDAALWSLCQLLSVPENHLPIIQHGTLPVLIKLSQSPNEELEKVCALCLFNLSCSPDSRKSVISSGAIPSIMKLAKGSSMDTKTRCAATLCNLANVEKGVDKMVHEGVVSMLVELLSSEDPLAMKYCCATLCRVANNESNCGMILKAGAAPYIIDGSLRGDDETKKFCCAVLSSLSVNQMCQEQLVSSGALEALIELSNHPDDLTRQRCLAAFANLSFEKTIKGAMIKSSVVETISNLSNSYHEQNQIHCARTLCNLACFPNAEMGMVEMGAVSALMMICMVRTVKTDTKEICIKALSNLLTSETLPHLLDEGIAQAIVVLSESESPQIRSICSSIFCELSVHLEGRMHLTENQSSLEQLFHLSAAHEKVTNLTCVKAVCNLLYHSDSRELTLKAGGMSVICRTTMLGNPQSELECALAFAKISALHSCIPYFKELYIYPVLTLLMKSTNVETRRFSSLALSNIAWNPDVRKTMLAANVHSIVLDILSTTNDDVVCRSISSVICYLAENVKGTSDLEPSIILGGLENLLRLSSDYVPCLQSISYFLHKYCSQGYSEELFADGESTIDLLIDLIQLSSCDSLIVVNCAMVLTSFVYQNKNKLATICCNSLSRCLVSICANPACDEMVSSIVYHIIKHTPATVSSPLLTNSLPESLLDISERSSSNLVFLLNICDSFYELSKRNDAKKFLIDSNAASVLLKFTTIENEEIKGICSRTLNNLSSAGDEGIEEGAVTALISMSLKSNEPSSKPSTSTSQGEDAGLRGLVPSPELESSSEAYGPPESIDQCENEEVSSIEITTFKFEGGVAGKGPDPPHPPPIDLQSLVRPIEEEQGSSRNIFKDTTDITIGRTKMALAKFSLSEDLLALIPTPENDLDVSGISIEEGKVGLSMGEDFFENSSNPLSEDFLNMTENEEKKVQGKKGGKSVSLQNPMVGDSITTNSLSQQQEEVKKSNQQRGSKSRGSSRSSKKKSRKGKKSSLSSSSLSTSSSSSSSSMYSNSYESEQSSFKGQNMKGNEESLYSLEFSSMESVGTDGISQVNVEKSIQSLPFHEQAAHLGLYNS